MERYVLATLSVVAFVGCGGSSSSSVEPACSPGGTWTVTATMTSNSGGNCASLPSPTTWTQDVTVNGGAMTWGSSWAGPFDATSCSGTLLYTASTTVYASDGTLETMMLTDTMHVSFSGSTLSGAESKSFIVPKTTPGLPCTANYTISGARM